MFSNSLLCLFTAVIKSLLYLTYSPPSLLRRHLTVESGGGKKFGEMPAINRHKNLHCAYRLAHANFDKRKLRGSRKGLQQGVDKFLFSTQWLKRRRITVKLTKKTAL
jgi:hypothetical protein